MPTVITYIYSIVRNVILTFEPGAFDEFLVLDVVFGYECP